MEPVSLLSQSMLPAGPVGGTPSVADRVVPSDLAVQRFNEIMQAAPGAQPTAGALAVQSALGAQAASPATLGSRILDSVQRTSTELSSRWQQVSATLDRSGHTLSVTDMLRIQTDLVQVSVQYELVGKAVAKSAQDVDSLVRIQ